MSKFYTREINRHNTVYKIFNIPILKLKNDESKAAAIVQNSFDLAQIKKSENLIIFFIPPTTEVIGGVMSIYSICEHSRKINSDYSCVIATLPGKRTIAFNDNFKNNEKIYRFEQITHNATNAKHVIIHIPEYFSKIFYKNLDRYEKQFLKNIPDLQINILNQNTKNMPDDISDLFKITDNITQTIAHNRYANQEYCNKFGIPLHYISVDINLKNYKKYSFEEKEKIILYSKDENLYKQNVLIKLKENFPNWQFIQIDNMTFSQYMDIVAKSYFIISFGEGMDGYFIQPAYVGTIGISVYNNNYFPDESWKTLKNVYVSYDEMINCICKDLHKAAKDEDLYYDIINKQRGMLDKIYNYDNFIENLTRFYNKDYDWRAN